MGIKEKLEYELVVIENFGEYVKGEIISDVKKIADLVDSEWQAHFVKKPIANTQ
jgi:hypothetical protein